MSAPQISEGARVRVTHPGGEHIGTGVVRYVREDLGCWYGVKLDGEHVVHEWPASHVWGRS